MSGQRSAARLPRVTRSFRSIEWCNSRITIGRDRACSPKRSVPHRASLPTTMRRPAEGKMALSVPGYLTLNEAIEHLGKRKFGESWLGRAEYDRLWTAALKAMAAPQPDADRQAIK